MSEYTFIMKYKCVNCGNKQSQDVIEGNQPTCEKCGGEMVFKKASKQKVA